MSHDEDEVMDEDLCPERAISHVGTSENSSYIASIFQRVLANFKKTHSHGTRSNAPRDTHEDSRTTTGDAELLRDAVMCEYLKPGSYTEKQVPIFKYTV